jgi:hypothetical protein
MKKGFTFFLLISMIFSILGCKASKKNCDCPTFPTKRPRGRGEYKVPTNTKLLKEYLIYGIVLQKS